MAKDAADWVPTEPGAQGRAAIDAIKSRMTAGDAMVWSDPVYTTTIGGKPHVLDGHHRWRAATSLGDIDIPHQNLTPDEVVDMFGQWKLDDITPWPEKA